MSGDLDFNAGPSDCLFWCEIVQFPHRIVGTPKQLDPAGSLANRMAMISGLCCTILCSARNYRR